MPSSFIPDPIKIANCHIKDAIAALKRNCDTKSRAYDSITSAEFFIAKAKEALNSAGQPTAPPRAR